MKLTDIRFKAKVIKNNPMTNPEYGWVEGFYFQDLDNGIMKHYIHECPMTWEIDPATLKIIRHPEPADYVNPKTTIDDIKELQKRLVQTTIDFIKEKNLTDINEVDFNVDGLEDSAIEYGEWVPGMDSSIMVGGLQSDENDDFRYRKIIGSYC
jgi:hypothetical protein